MGKREGKCVEKGKVMGGERLMGSMGKRGRKVRERGELKRES